MNNPNPLASHAVLGQEWSTLQNNYEQYETTALLVKLTAIALCVVGWLFAALDIAAAVVAVLWIQEGILKTYQSRLGVRLLRIEALIRQPELLGAPFQLHSEWLASRRGMKGLLVEYAVSIAKPTVGFPYVVLLLLALITKMDLLG